MEADTPAAAAPKKPKFSRFTQQELPACRPLLTPIWVISIFGAIAVAFIGVGVAALIASQNTVEVGMRYDDVCFGGNDTQFYNVLQLTGGNGNNCTVRVQITESLTAPVYIYYQLTNYFQNHRRYVKSRNDQQLRSGPGQSISGCSPEDYQGNGTSNEIFPCGLIAWSLFNDTYTLRLNGSLLNVSADNIAWPNDPSRYSSAVPQNYNNIPALAGGATVTTPLNEDQRFMVWMRTAALPTFRKLWGVINVDIPAGSVLAVDIDNRYNTYTFGGTKTIVVTETSWLGGKNDFLGIAYISVGGISGLLGVLFLVLHMTKPRQLGDVNNIGWNSRP